MAGYGTRALSALVIREARARPVLCSPPEVALRILEHRYGPIDQRGTAPDSLLDFQREAVDRARAVLARRGGVLIADSVGLGKTHIALGLLRPYIDAGGRALVVGPASLKHHWRASLGGSASVGWTSYSRLGRGAMADAGHDYVVFDEAHALRNPATQRYRAAAALCRRSRVVLLTATPVNNSIWDLYHLLRLFARDADFRDVGVGSLRSAFEESESAALLGNATALQPVLRSVMIRRTRPFLRERVGAGRNEAGLAFPRQAPPVTVRYALTAADEPESGDGLVTLGSLLLDMEFPAHDGAADRTPSPLMRMGLLKRLESSAHSLRRSMDAYDSLLLRCEEGLHHGVLIRAHDEAVRDASDAQLRLDALLFSALPAGFDAHAHRARIERERARVRRICEELDRTLRADAKLAALIELLRGTLRGRKTLIFTQFRDTAEYLHSRLCRALRVGLVTGTNARLGPGVADRRAVILRFAPHANGAPRPAASETIDVLIATDVLSEGINLQDADVVISYDLPWNPIRLIQRIGRVDRLGSPHPIVASYHFVPGDLERYLRLLDRIARKAAAIDASVGSEMPALHAELLRSLDRDARATIRRIEKDDADWFEIDERLLAARSEYASAGPASDACTPSAAPFAPDALPVALVAGTDATQSGLVAALVGGRFVWVAMRGGMVVQDERLCARMVESALAGAPSAATSVVPTPELEALLAIARPVLARRAAGDATSALLPAGGDAARIGRTLLSLAAGLPGGPDGPTCVRIERGLERLARLPPVAQASLASRPDSRSDRAGRLNSLLTGIEGFDQASSEGIVGRAGNSADRSENPRRGADVRLIGVLLERPAGVD